jgi:hypothetical protein
MPAAVAIGKTNKRAPKCVLPPCCQLSIRSVASLTKHPIETFPLIPFKAASKKGQYKEDAEDKKCSKLVS